MVQVSMAMMVSIDGFIADENGGLDWMHPHVGPQVQSVVLEALQNCDGLLVGRVSYEGMAAFWPNESNPVADLMNERPKAVFTRTLTETKWVNSRPVSGDLADEVAALRKQATKDLLVLGGANLVQSLTAEGLIDTYQFITVPVVLGRGIPLFTEPMNLELESTTRMDGNAVMSVYRRV